LVVSFWTSEKSVFPGGVGNTQKDPGRFDSLLGAERPHLQEWRARGW
jgi:hypothetical protein